MNLKMTSQNWKQKPNPPPATHLQPPTAEACRNPPTIKEKLLREEADNLADYLRIDKSINDAWQAFKKEIKMAELKHGIRESKRDKLWGAICNSSRMTIGAMANAWKRGCGASPSTRISSWSGYQHGISALDSKNNKRPCQKWIEYAECCLQEVDIPVGYDSSCLASIVFKIEIENNNVKTRASNFIKNRH